MKKVANIGEKIGNRQKDENSKKKKIKRKSRNQNQCNRNEEFLWWSHKYTRLTEEIISEPDDSSTEPAKIEMQRKRMKKSSPPKNRVKHPRTLEQYLKVLHVCNVNTRNRIKKDYSRMNVWSNDQAFSKMNRYQQHTQEVQRISNRINI